MLSLVIDTFILFDKLGFVMHPDKSVFFPSQEIVLLGFIINSVDMTIKLTNDKAIALKLDCEKLLKQDSPTIRELARVIGKIISSIPGVMHGALYFRSLESDKSAALKDNYGNFDRRLSLSTPAKTELTWWINNVMTSCNVISHDLPSHTLTTDASCSGSGAVYDSTVGIWSFEEKSYHINYLELLAVFLGLKCYFKSFSNTHIRLRIDNTTALAAINHMGTSHSHECNNLSKSIWEWCKTRNIWLSAVHIPGVENVLADAESRKTNINTEWMIDPEVLGSALDQLNFLPDIDLFASRVNTICQICLL